MRGTKLTAKSMSQPGALSGVAAEIQKGGKPLRRMGKANVQPKAPKGGAIISSRRGGK